MSPPTKTGDNVCGVFRAISSPNNLQQNQIRILHHIKGIGLSRDAFDLRSGIYRIHFFPEEKRKS
jgi:hypothetical protein